MTPRGLRIARWYCPEGHRTFSLLPDFVAARLPGLLASIEDTITVAASAKSIEAAADTLRAHEVSLPSALRWLRRRLRPVQAALDAVSPRRQTPMVGVASRSGLLPHLDQGLVLLALRRSLSSDLLYALPPPLGFRSWRSQRQSCEGHQHKVGPDGDLSACYSETTDLPEWPCNVPRVMHVPMPPHPPP